MKDPLLINHEYSESPFGFGSSSSSSSSSSFSSSSTSRAGCPPTRSTISTSESGQELWPVGVKLGIVRLGHAAGKLKYTLVDEQDIVLAREYTFEARLEVDLASGSGAVVFAYAYLTSRQSRQAAILLQDLIWRRHNGPIPERQRVVHRNHISMDNRLDNLCLIDIRNAHVWYTRANAVKTGNGGGGQNNNNNNQQPQQQQQQLVLSNADKSAANDLHLTLYWAAIQQLPPEQQAMANASGGSAAAAASAGNVNGGSQSNEVSSSTSSSSSSASSSPSSPSSNSHHHHHHHHSHSHHRSSSLPKCYDAEGNLIDSEEGGIVYYECHYPPCVRIEREPREFSICGRCQETRYCGTVCQQLDWPHHKRSCRSRSHSRRTPYGPPPTASGDSGSGGSGSRWGQQQQQ